MTNHLPTSTCLRKYWMTPKLSLRMSETPDFSYTGGQVYSYRQFLVKHFDLYLWKYTSFRNKQYLIWKPQYRASIIIYERGHGSSIKAATPSWMKKHYFQLIQYYVSQWREIPSFNHWVNYHILGLSKEVYNVFIAQLASKWQLVKLWNV